MIKKSIYNSIINGLDEAIEYERGNTSLARRCRITIRPLPQYKSIEIKRIRKKLNLSQSAFAQIFGVSAKTVEAWESGRNIPAGPSQRILDIMKSDSGFVEKYKIMCTE